jgi:hypothetical protein
MTVLVTGILGSNERMNVPGELVASLMDRLPQELNGLSSQRRFELINADNTSTPACQKHLLAPIVLLHQAMVHTMCG